MLKFIYIYKENLENVIRKSWYVTKNKRKSVTNMILCIVYQKNELES